MTNQTTLTTGGIKGAPMNEPKNARSRLLYDLHTVLMGLAERMSNLEESVGSHIDRLIGEQPRPEEAELAGNGMLSGGIIGDLHYVAHGLHVQMERIERQIQHLEGL